MTDDIKMLTRCLAAEQKYVYGRIGAQKVYAAAPCPVYTDEIRHREIVWAHNLTLVGGGGRVSLIRDGERTLLKIYGKSKDYGTPNTTILEKLKEALKEDLKDTLPNLEVRVESM